MQNNKPGGTKGAVPSTAPKPPKPMPSKPKSA